MMLKDNDPQPVIYNFDMSTQQSVIEVLNSDPQDVKTALEEEIGKELIPELKNQLNERWGICYDYIWALTGETWYLIEKQYSPFVTFTGKFCVYPGTTLISFCLSQEVASLVAEYLESTELRKYYKFSPALSYHVTIHHVGSKLQFGSMYEEVISRIGHSIVDWNSNRWVENPDHRMRGRATDIYFRETMGIHYQFEKEDGAIVKNSRDLCRQKFGIPDDKVKCHLTLGYKYNLEMPPPELTQEVGQRVIQLIGQYLEVGLPVFCQYESVSEYDLFV